MDSSNGVFRRPVQAVAALGEAALDVHRFLDKRVLVTGDSFLLTHNGLHCLGYSIRLTSKICRNISVALPGDTGSLADQVESITKAATLGAPISVSLDEPDPSDFDAILSIASHPFPHHRATTINSNGWMARIGSRAESLIGPTNDYNPLGALAAASLACSEVFKRLISLKPDRGQLIDGLTFSVFDYSSGGTDSGPRLPRQLEMDAAMVGLGAIGSASASLIADLPMAGRLRVIDPEVFETVNLSTCLPIGPRELGTPKATFVKDLLSPGLEVEVIQRRVEDTIDQLGGEHSIPSIFLNGVDSVGARIAVQDLWPDTVIDGAMGGPTIAQVSVHPWGTDVACLKCLFREGGAEPIEVVQQRSTGLSMVRLSEVNSLVNEEDVLLAPETRRTWLKARVGKPVCSVIEEGVADEMSMQRQRAEFRPAVPFVATMSATFVVGELVRHLMGLSTPLEPRFQMDLLQGPSRGEFFPQERRRDCECVARQRNIDRFRRQRHSSFERGQS